ncbi:MAG: DNA primase [Actinomycetales bacterium]|nr:MAG: DNA primase [Actinomycetales bacterium]
MAGRIRAEDILAVKERAAIEDIVRDHVTLRRTGSSFKGLCPFHDEKTPSFNVNPANGYYHCYGCGEGGDVISFVSKVEQLSFTEAVERLAAKVGVELRYEDGGRRDDHHVPGQRARLVEAHRVAQEFYAAYLLAAPEARGGRDFMRARGFDSAVATHFGIGFAPRGGQELVRHLRAKGFTDDELLTGGLAGQSPRGLYDWFRGRLLWPIRDRAGDVVGFGARRIFDDDRIAAKYLNTAKTPIFEKSKLLYGLDLARRAIAQQRVAVVVEGYTDVMACHLAGVGTAVASCGTAFGGEHISVLRRIMRDEPDLAPARVVFTFDGDAAGQAAAMKAFKQDQRWASQSFVAIAPGGQDPCELRQNAGDAAVRDLVEDAVPMFEFAVRTTIGRFDLDTAEGRVQAIRAAAPIVAGIRDRALRPEYTRMVAGWVGVEVEQVRAEVRRAGRGAGDHSGAGGPSADVGRPAAGHAARADRSGDGGTQGWSDADPDPASIEPTASELAAALPPPDLRHPIVQAERQLLQCLLQFPDAIDPPALAEVAAADFTAPAHQAVYAAVAAAGVPDGRSAAAWFTAVAEQVLPAAQPLLSELAVAPLPVVPDPLTGQPSVRYVESLFVRLREAGLSRRIADAMGQLRRNESSPEPDPVISRDLGAQLQQLQIELAALRSREEG